MSDTFQIGSFANSQAGVRTYIARLDGEANFTQVGLMPRGADRKTAVVEQLIARNQQSMAGVAPALDALKAQGLITNYTVNALANTVTYDVAEGSTSQAWKAVNAIEGVGQIVRNRYVAQILDAPTAGTTPVAAADAPTGIEWNVQRVNAPKVWEQGVKGAGVTIGIVDTGVDVTHPALNAKYRGTQADGSFDNNYNFFDAVNKKAQAYDDNEHGSHVTGTNLGSTATYDTGMAPDAKFIASKILNSQGSGTLDGVMKGLAWMLAPTKSDGTDADPTKAPDIVSNSWGTNDGRSTQFAGLIKSFIAAGIEPVFAAGNAGPRPGTVGAPGSDPNVISVAATDKDDKVASFSSRGPSPVKGPDGSDRKPDISAPGKDIVSSIPGGGYASFSGTSMATPAVAGVLALLLSKHKDLTHEEIMKAITTSARDLDAPGYDYNTGAGLIDAEAALKVADAIVAARTLQHPLAAA
jgi:bacillopeptidase F